MAKAMWNGAVIAESEAFVTIKVTTIKVNN